jgi:hypothetical protein
MVSDARKIQFCPKFCRNLLRGEVVRWKSDRQKQSNRELPSGPLKPGVLHSTRSLPIQMNGTLRVHRRDPAPQGLGYRKPPSPSRLRDEEPSRKSRISSSPLRRSSLSASPYSPMFALETLFDFKLSLILLGIVSRSDDAEL